MNLKIIASVIGIAITAIAAYLSRAATFGSRPSKEDRERFALSANYDKEKGQFFNQDRDALETMSKRMSLTTFLKLQVQSVKDSVPASPLPTIKPNVSEFMAPSEAVKAIWFGHSTLLFNVEGKSILVDPVFSNYAAPFSFMIKRFQPAALKLSELPNIDYVIISHDHYDHLDIESIRYFADKKTAFIVSLGVGSHLRGWGIDASRITELDWGQKHETGGLSFIATPAQHYSGRSLWRKNETLWSGWVIQNAKHRVFYSGDSGYGRHFKEIGDKYGPFEAAFIDVGQYNTLWEEVHLLPKYALEVFRGLKPKHFIPVHWGAFSLAKHAWYEPIVQISRLAAEKGIPLLTPRLGETMVMDDQFKTVDWWTEMIGQESPR